MVLPFVCYNSIGQGGCQVGEEKFGDRIEIADRKVGLGHPCFIIAEAGVNHNGSLEMACQLIEVAAQAGADAVKFQIFKAKRLVSEVAKSQYNMLCGLELWSGAYPELMTCCEGNGILFMCTPFDEESADFLDDLGVAVFKIASGEIANLPLLAHVARKGKAVIVSTGMSYLGEVEAAVRTIREAGNCQLVLLQCVSSYPAEPAAVNLRAMMTMAAAFGVPVGYSDHTLGVAVSLAAVALGACVIEKHFTLARGLPGPDHAASLEVGELTALVEGVRIVEAALGGRWW